MGMNWGAVAAGIGVGLVTGNPLAGAAVYGSMSAVDAQNSANKQNVEMQQATNAQQVELANTAHQREVADLKAAGLNPILSAKYGGASTPGLVSPSVQSVAPQYESSARAMHSAILDKQNLMADLAVKKSQVMANSAQAVKTAAEAQNVMYDNDVKQFTQPVRMKEGYNKAVAGLLSERNRAMDEHYRSARPPFVKSFGRQWSDIFRSSTGKN